MAFGSQEQLSAIFKQLDLLNLITVKALKFRWDVFHEFRKWTVSTNLNRLPSERFGSAMLQLKISEIKFQGTNVHEDNRKI